MNIFEGSRRIAKVIAGLWAIGTLSAAFYDGIELFDFKAFFELFGGGLVFIWAFTWIVGWITRGFMGIPRGQDSKPVADGSP
jgi:hypothetical protein